MAFKIVRRPVKEHRFSRRIREEYKDTRETNIYFGARFSPLKKEKLPRGAEVYYDISDELDEQEIAVQDAIFDKENWARILRVNPEQILNDFNDVSDVADFSGNYATSYGLDVYGSIRLSGHPKLPSKSEIARQWKDLLSKLTSPIEYSYYLDDNEYTTYAKVNTTFSINEIERTGEEGDVDYDENGNMIVHWYRDEKGRIVKG